LVWTAGYLPSRRARRHRSRSHQRPRVSLSIVQTRGSFASRSLIVVEIDVAASGREFVKTSASASAGPAVIRSMNPQSTGHDIALKGNGVDETGDIVSEGGVSTITVADLKPGTYTCYCSVPGHEQAGMKGTLTVS
jgi:plastocyanin